jgi:hypothetical protein
MAAVVNMEYRELRGRWLSGNSITESDGSGNVHVNVYVGGCGRGLPAELLNFADSVPSDVFVYVDVPVPVRMNRSVWRRGRAAPIIGP